MFYIPTTLDAFRPRARLECIRKFLESLSAQAGFIPVLPLRVAGRVGRPLRAQLPALRDTVALAQIHLSLQNEKNIVGIIVHVLRDLMSRLRY